MKINSFFLSIFLLISCHLNTLANEITTQIHCINKQIHLVVNSNQLHLTEDAIVDNTGGYVDIPEERLYLKSNSTLFTLQGKVIKIKNDMSQLQAIIQMKDIKNLSLEKPMVLIQKIDLLENNKTPLKENLTTTNKVTLSLDKTKLDLALQKCLK